LDGILAGRLWLRHRLLVRLAGMRLLLVVVAMGSSSWSGGRHCGDLTARRATGDGLFAWLSSARAIASAPSFRRRGVTVWKNGSADK
jgi:hypothetical protein